MSLKAHARTLMEVNGIIQPAASQPPPRIRYRYGRPAAKTTIKITQWHGQTIAAGHSLLTKVNRLADSQEQDELTTLSIRGREGSGKTTIARVMAHYLHLELERRAAGTKKPDGAWARESKEALRRGYIVRVLDDEALKNFSNTLAALPDANRILIFDDTSFMGSSASRAVQKIKKEVTTVRHGASADYRTVLIYNFHYSKGLDPYLRDTQFFVQTGTTSGEMGALSDLYGTDRANEHVLQTYRNWDLIMKRKRQVTIGLSAAARDSRTKAAGNGVTYKYSNPFRLAMFYDQERLQIMVYPSMAKAGVDDCTICNPGGAAGPDGPAGGAIDVGAALEFVQNSTSKDAVGAALKDMFIRRYGRDPYDRKANQARIMIERLEANHIATYEQMIGKYQEGKANKNQALDDLITRARRPLRLKSGTRERFAARFKVDGMRAPNDKPLGELDGEKQLADLA